MEEKEAEMKGKRVSTDTKKRLKPKTRCMNFEKSVKFVA